MAGRCMIKSIPFYFLLAVMPGLAFAEDTAITATAAEQEMLTPEVVTSGSQEKSTLGANTERVLFSEGKLTRWGEDESIYDQEKFETVVKKVENKIYNTKKLKDVVPPIHFKSGKADIPEEYVERFREILYEMRDRVNVRLHFIGHSDDAQLQGELKAKYGDNLGLSKERAGTTAEFFLRALNLPPEAISYEGLGEANPIASNKTDAGKAQNRRVEVQVWYDEVSTEMLEQEVEVQRELKRIKVCRVETVCKLRYKVGYSQRAKLKNLVPQLQFDDTQTDVPAQYLQQLRHAIHNLRNKENVQLRFIGFTDNVPLTGRLARIYGDHKVLSKARARRAALIVQEALGLPAEAISIDGKGSNNPVASNNSEKGRSLNRRIEVQFWHDDPLTSLPDEPQICPEAAAAETVERIYNPPEGDVKSVFFEKGKPVIPTGYVNRLRRAMEDVKDKGNVRLRFIGFTSNEHLDRRTAMVYGDDIGLSTARARRVMELIRTEMELTPEQAEFEGHGYVHSSDVINAGFLEVEHSKVDVQIVYDDLATLDDSEGLEINRLTRDVDTKNPFSLNLMRISVDGQPLNDPQKAVPDVQRCTDVALDKADIQFKFDSLMMKPRLNVTVWPDVISQLDNVDTEIFENQANFKMYSNYPSFIEKAEIRLFRVDQSTRDEPIAVVPVNKDGLASWKFKDLSYLAPRTELQFVLRVFDKKGLFDETRPQSIWIVDELDESIADKDINQELLIGYGENRLGLNNIYLDGATVKVFGKGVPEDHRVFYAGHALPLGDNGEFASELILPKGMHTVEVSVTDQSGSGYIYLRDLEIDENELFYVGIADLTFSRDSTNGPAELVTGDTTHFDNDLSIDGRLAFYAKAKTVGGLQITASADTREGPLNELFKNFMNKSPDSVFRRLDPDIYYPTFGDDSTIEEDAPTSGKFYLRVQKDRDYALWGNFNINYNDNNLAHVDRSLHGLNLNYESKRVNSFGESSIAANVFAAEPGAVAGRDEFRGTGGSLYYLRHQDILMGSDRIRVEVRDGSSGLVVAVKNLAYGQDYDIDYLQGRILLTDPLSSSAVSDMLVDSGDTGGYKVFLVARYEYTPGFDDINDIAAGGRVHYWLNDNVKFGVTSNNQEIAGIDSSLNALDITLRKNAGSWVRLEASKSQGPVSSSQLSGDGGFNFVENALIAGTDIEADGKRIEAGVRFDDLLRGVPGKMSFYNQSLGAGYAAPGLIAQTDTRQSGAIIEVPIGSLYRVKLKVDTREQEQSLATESVELNVDFQMSKNWLLSGGWREDKRSDDSVVVPLTQSEGKRSDLVVRLDYDSRTRWGAYSYAQGTLDSTGSRDDNARLGVGGSYRTTDRFKINGEVSGGDLGSSVKLGTEYKMGNSANVYTNYSLGNERNDSGVNANVGKFVAGFKNRFSDSASIYVEERYTHGDVPEGLVNAFGFELAITNYLTFGGNIDTGTLTNNTTGAETSRSAAGLQVGYKSRKVTYAGALEYRLDEQEQVDLAASERTTWLTRNVFKYQVNHDWRFISKLNYSFSESSKGEFYNGDFTEAVLGYAYRPVAHDALNALVKYTYFYNLPTTDQVTLSNTSAEYIQKSKIFSLDVMYDLTRSWSLGTKLAHRFGQLSVDRVDPQFFDSNASLYILRAEWHLTHRWDVTVEGRMLEVDQAEDARTGALLAVYHHFGENLKLGVGYNFTDFSDDLTDLDYDSQGLFINIVGKL